MRLLQAKRLSKVGDDSTGFERQELSCQQYAGARGHEIVAVAEDPNISGDRDPFERPGLGPWLRKRSDEYDGIIAAYLDRLGRNARQLSSLRNWAEDTGKRLIVVSPSLEWPPGADDLASPIIWDVLTRLAEYELAAITRRNRETGTWLRANNYLVGKPMFGYKVVPHPDDPRRKTLTPDEDLRPYLEEMVDRAIQGDTWASIAAWLDSEGVRPQGGGQWAITTLGQILRNPLLVGRRKNSRGGTDLRVPAVISAEKWTKLQRVLEKKTQGSPHPRSGALLAGRLVCMNGHTMYERRNTHQKNARGEPLLYRYYRCKHNCVNIKADDVEGFVSRLYTAVLGDRERTEVITVPGVSYEADIELVEVEIRSLDLDDPSFLARQEELMAERQRLRELPAEPDRTEERGTGERMSDWWARVSDLERREYLEEHGQYFIVYGKGDYRPATRTTPQH